MQMLGVLKRTLGSMGAQMKFWGIPLLQPVCMWGYPCGRMYQSVDERMITDFMRMCTTMMRILRSSVPW